MSLIKPKNVYDVWMLRDFPLSIKEQFKTKCKEKNVDMVDKLKGLTRNYVNETTELYKEKRIVEIAPHDRGVKRVFWKMHNFPCKLKAEFKSCCGARGDKLTDAVAHLIKEYVKEEDNG